MSKSDKPTAEQGRHWNRVAELGCLITRRPAEIAHMHGPSLRERDPRFLKPKGKKTRWMHWLVVPLTPEIHWLCDNDPRAFAAACGTPAELLDIVAERTGVDIWAKARECLKPVPERT